MTTKPSTIDEYLAGVGDDVRATLEQLRRTIHALVPEAVESIGYGMPAFKYRGKPLIYFAAAKHHCALYGTPHGTLRFAPGEPPSDDLVRGLLDERIAAIEAAPRRPGAKKPT